MPEPSNWSLYNPYDMYLFDKALYERKIISNESFMKMFTPNKATYGMGFYVSPGSYSSHGVMPGYNILNSFSLTGSRYVILCIDRLVHRLPWRQCMPEPSNWSLYNPISQLGILRLVFRYLSLNLPAKYIRGLLCAP